LFRRPETRLGFAGAIFLHLGQRFQGRFYRFRWGSDAVGRVLAFIFVLDRRLGWYAIGLKAVWRLIEGLFGHPESVDRRRHATIEDHLGNNL